MKKRLFSLGAVLMCLWTALVANNSAKGCNMPNPPTFSTNVCNGHSVTVNVQDGRYLAFGELQNEDLVTSDWYNLASNDDQIIFTFRPN
jgi:hypothetical protein